MGETCENTLRLEFDCRLEVEFHGTNVAGGPRLLAYRELDGALGLTSIGDSESRDTRTYKNTQHNTIVLLGQSIYSRLAG